MIGPAEGKHYPRSTAIPMRRSLPIDRPEPLRSSPGERRPAGCARRVRVLGPALVLCLLVAGGCDEQAPQQRIENAQAHLQRGEMRAAVAELKRVLQEQPENAGVRLMLGKLYLSSGDLPYAEKELERARALGPASPELMGALGELWLKQGRREQLLRELDPQDDWPRDARMEIYRLRARALTAIGAVAAARRAYEAMLQIAPDDVDARIGLVRLAIRAEDPGASDAFLFVHRPLVG